MTGSRRSSASCSRSWVTPTCARPVDGRGNFGSQDDDPPADAQYTEVRLAPIAHELEHFPNAVVNGPLPHNLREVAEAAQDPSRVLVPDFPTGGVLTRFDAGIGAQGVGARDDAAVGRHEREPLQPGPGQVDVALVGRGASLTRLAARAR